MHSDDSDIDSDNEIQTQQASNVLIAIDCNSSMFVKDSDSQIPFEFALRSLYSVCDHYLLKRSAKNQISIAFFHPEKTDLIDFDSPFVEGVKNLSESIKQFKTYNLLDCGSSKTLTFSYFLILCKKKFSKLKHHHKKFFYLVTNHSDPCNGDAVVQSQAFREIMDFPKLGIHFELLPLCEDFDYEPFYAEAYRTLGEKEPKFFYNASFLTTKVNGTIKHRETNKNLKIYLSPDSANDVFVPCLERKLIGKAKILTNMFCTKDLKMVEKKTERNEKMCEVQISEDIRKELSESEVHDLYNSSNVKLGLTVLHAQHRRYSNYGEYVADPKVIKTKVAGDESFAALHTACSQGGYSLLCLLKYKIGGRVHYAEIIPKIINQEPHFVMFTLKNSLNYFERPKEQKVVVQADEELEQLMSTLVKGATIHDYDKRKMIPLKHAKQAKFLKQRLFEDDSYLADQKDLDLVNDVLYDADGVDELVEKLKLRFPEETKKRPKAPTKPRKKAKN